MTNNTTTAIAYASTSNIINNNNNNTFDNTNMSSSSSSSSSSSVSATLYPTTCDAQSTKTRIGYTLSAKKRRWFGEFVDHARDRYPHVEFVDLDLDRSIEEQGPFDMIVHKLAHLYAAAHSRGDAQAMARLANLRNYLDAHPEVVHLDNVQCVEDVMDRKITCDKLASMNIEHDGETVEQPAYHVAHTNDELAALCASGELEFPLVCKPFLADGNDDAHQMALVLRPEGLLKMHAPVVLQKFVDHDATLFKLYIIGDHVTVLRRPSLENVDQWSFHGRANSPDHMYFERISNARLNGAMPGPAIGQFVPDPSMDMVRKIAHDASKRLGLSLFGLDVITNTRTNKHYVIDVNFMPGYYGVPDLFDRLLSHILSQVPKAATSTISPTTTTIAPSF